jgi:hypothetical protein
MNSLPGSPNWTGRRPTDDSKPSTLVFLHGRGSGGGTIAS